MRENAPLKNWTIENRLSEIVVPTLVINGRYDMFQDYVVEPLFQKLPLVKWVTLGNSSHTSFWEDRERYMMLVSGFLSS
jgi:pimeloyl-ACP methyl ester carboxylesterase